MDKGKSHGGCYYGDLGFSQDIDVIVNFKGKRLPEDQIRYNKKFNGMRYLVEHVIGLLKGQFPLLQNMKSYDIGTAMDIVAACIVVYNFALLYDNTKIEITGEEIDSYKEVLNTLNLQTEKPGDDV